MNINLLKILEEVSDHLGGQRDTDALKLKAKVDSTLIAYWKEQATGKEAAPVAEPKPRRKYRRRRKSKAETPVAEAAPTQKRTRRVRVSKTPELPV